MSLYSDNGSARASGRNPAYLEIQELSKRFGPTHALTSVSLTIWPGEVHGLLGQNGSGKSTLIKVLAGYEKADAGHIFIEGVDVTGRLRHGAFQELGVSFVHQDLGLIPSLSIVENALLDEMGHSHAVNINWRHEGERVEAALEAFGLAHLDAWTEVSQLEPVSQALVAIWRAARRLLGAGRSKGLLVLDEPTVHLPAEEVARLFALVRNVASRGISVLFVSHDIGEVLQVTDRVTVLTDGLVTGAAETANLSEQGLVALIVGDKRGAQAQDHASTPKQAASDPRAMTWRTTADQVRAITTARADSPSRRSLWRRRTAAAGSVSMRHVSSARLCDVSLDVSSGTILGLTGPRGSGYQELLYALFGANRFPCTGTVTFSSHHYDLAAMTPEKAIAHHVGLVPADRTGAGLIGALNVEENVTVLRLQAARRWWLDSADIRSLAEEARRAYQIKCSSVAAPIDSLSGGNQQRVLLAKALVAAPDLLLLDEPTQGVDVGARTYIFDVVRRAAADGVAVVIASSDLGQLATLCDDVAVFRHGRIGNRISGHPIRRDALSAAVYGHALGTRTSIRQTAGPAE